MEKINKNSQFNSPIVIILLSIIVIMGVYFLYNQNNNTTSTQQQPIDTTPPIKKSATANPPTPKDLPSIIAEWSPSAALILCNFNNGDSDFGSGFLYSNSDGSIKVLTNKHVLTEDIQGNLPVSCSIKIPGNGNNFYTQKDSDTFVINDKFDWAFFNITNGDTYFNGIAKRNGNLSVCQKQERTGDSIVILGYPDYAGQFANPTATEGIISGYASPYYTTSAQIESGNSGGIAIDIKNDCYIGIPSAVKLGQYANLGRILNANVPFNLSY